MADRIMKSAEKTEAAAKAVEEDFPEVTSPLYELAAKHGFKLGTVINPQNLQEKGLYRYGKGRLQQSHSRQ